MNHQDFDLNLLRAFHAVHQARNVRRAAEAIGLSQPAVSHALTRLRLTLKDPLFVRTAGGVAPTARADHFAGFVEAALRSVETGLRETGRFDPATSARAFTLHMSDLGEGEFLPALMERLRAEAPGVRLASVQLDADAIGPALERARIDLAVGYLPALAGVEHAPLLSDRYVVLLRRGHPQAGALRRRAALARCDWVLVQSHAEPARALQRLGLEAQVRLAVPHFNVLPEILARTDLAAIVPWQPATRMARTHGLALVDAALGLPPLKVALHWHWRASHDPGHRWLRDTLAALFGEVRSPARARSR